MGRGVRIRANTITGKGQREIRENARNRTEKEGRELGKLCARSRGFPPSPPPLPRARNGPRKTRPSVKSLETTRAHLRNRDPHDASNSVFRGSSGTSLSSRRSSRRVAPRATRARAYSHTDASRDRGVRARRVPAIARRRAIVTSDMEDRHRHCRHRLHHR